MQNCLYMGICICRLDQIVGFSLVNKHIKYLTFTFYDIRNTFAIFYSKTRFRLDLSKSRSNLEPIDLDLVF